jgi:hypothetical protein
MVCTFQQFHPVTDQCTLAIQTTTRGEALQHRHGFIPFQTAWLLSFLPCANNAHAFSVSDIKSETALHAAFERTTLTPSDATLGDSTVEGVSATLSGRIHTALSSRVLAGASARAFGFFQGADLEQLQFGKQETGTFDSSVYGFGAGASAVFNYSPRFSQQIEVDYDIGTKGNIKAKIGLFNFDETISRLSRVSAQTAFRTTLWRGLFADIGATFFKGSFTSESNTSMSMFSSAEKKSNTVEFSSYGAFLGIGWRFSSAPSDVLPPNPPQHNSQVIRPSIQPQKSGPRSLSPQTAKPPAKKTPAR